MQPREPRAVTRTPAGARPGRYPATGRTGGAESDARIAMESSPLVDARCPRCRALLLRQERHAIIGRVEIKCRRCDAVIDLSKPNAGAATSRRSVQRTDL